MKVGVLKDIKVGEYRVIATPAEVSMLVGDGKATRVGFEVKDGKKVRVAKKTGKVID